MACNDGDAVMDLYEPCGHFEDGVACARREVEHFPFSPLMLVRAAVVAARCQGALGLRDEAQQVCWRAAERAGRLKLRFLELLLQKEAVLIAQDAAQSGQSPSREALAAVGRAMAGVVASAEELSPLPGGIDAAAALAAAAAEQPGPSANESSY